jgi:hypothetical protein
MNSIISIQSGVPFTPFSSSTSYDLNKNGVSSDRLVPTVNAASTYASGTNPADGYLDSTLWGKSASGKITYYKCPSGQWCDAPIGRNSLIGPGYANVDFNMTKKFKVNERSAFTFQANFFNLFNRANFGLPTANITSSTFGKSTSTYDPRVTQLALRFDF